MSPESTSGVWLVSPLRALVSILKQHYAQGALLKNEQDVALFERLAFLSRRENTPRRGPSG